MDAPKITFPTENNPGIPSGIEKGKAFRLQEAKLQINRTQGLKRSRIETFLSAQEEKNNTRGSARDHISYRKQPGIPSGIEKGKAFRFKTPSSILIVGPSGCRKTCFTVVTLGSLGRIVCEPSTHDTLLIRGVARWIPNHERSVGTI